jgi:hypothetical protein
MQCPSCGHQNRTDASFCVKCGAPLTQSGQATTAPPSSQFNTQNAGPGGLGWQSSTTMSQPLPVSPPKQPMAPPSHSAPPTPPVKHREHGGIVGVARNIQLRQALSVSTGLQETILTFRLEQYDSGGNRTRVVPVEIRGLSLTGFISDGDWAEVSGKVKDGMVRAKQVRNLTTGGVVGTKGISTAVKVVWVIGLVILAFVVYLIVFQGILNPASHPGGFGTPSNSASSDDVLNTYCSDLGSGAYQWAYDQYSTRLKSEVSSAQLSQMWSGKFIDSCTHDSVQVSGKQATTTLSITAKILANQSPPPEQTYTYHIVLVQDGSNGWKIDSLQSQ